MVLKSAVVVEYPRRVLTPSLGHLRGRPRMDLRTFLWDLSIAFLIPYVSGSKALHHATFLLTEVRVLPC